MASLRRSSGSQHHLSTATSTINNKQKISNVNVTKEKQFCKGQMEGKKKEDLKMCKAELGDYVSNKKHSSNHVNKKQTQYRTNSIHNTKRPQTPDPISSHLPPSLQIEIPKYSQPETILKQIQKNVNFLKQMYYASLSQSQSQSQSHSYQVQHGSSFTHQQNHNYSNQSDIQHQIQDNAGKRNYKKVRPSINLVQHHINYNNDNDNLEQKYETKKNNNLKDVNEVKSKSKSSQKKQKMNQQRRKSSSNTQINPKTTLTNKSSIYNNTKQKLSTNKYQAYNIQKNPSKHTSPHSSNNIQQKQKQKQSVTPNNSSVPSSNINSLFQIFKYYKRSIDSSLSKRQQNYNTHSHANNNNTNNQTGNTTIRNNESHRSSMSNIYTNNPINLIKDMKNTHIQHPPSYNNNINNKETPNNSTTKNTTNNKNSTISQLYGSSIQPSIQVSFDEQQLQQENGINNQNNQNNDDKLYNKIENFDKNRSSKMSKRSRKSSKSNSAKKSIEQEKYKGNSNKGKSKNKSQKKSQKFKKSVNYPNDDINLKDHKDYHKELMHIKSKHENKKQSIKQSSNNSNKHKISSAQPQKSSLFKKKSQKIPELNSNFHPKTTKFEPYEQEHQHQHQHQHQHDHIDFPQIQSSLFDRNMPILEQDSREDVSSELLAITGRKQNMMREQFRENSQNYTNQSQKQVKCVKQKGSNNNNQIRMNFVQRNRLQLQFQQIQFSMKNSRDNITGQNSKQQQQNTRFPTPSFVSSDISQKNDKNIKICNPESAPKNNNCLRIDQIDHQIKMIQVQVEKQKYLSQSQRKKCDDSLAGCQIPKRYSDESLDNFQLVSIEL